MKYKHGFLAVCVSTSLILCFFILWSSSPSQEYGITTVFEPLPIKLDNSLLNFTDFKFLINNNPCDEADILYNNISIVQIVTSFAGNVEARSALRRAYSSTELKKLGIVRVFLLAALKPKQSEVTQRALMDENNKFSDLVQGNFYEAYRNLTYKHIMGLKWASIYCPNVKYIVKMDDDIIVNMYKLRKIISTKSKNGFQMMGHVFKNKRPIRLKANKWYVTKEEYSGSMYPKFLSGWLYITTPQVIYKLLSVAHSVPYFWIDDLYVTGILAQKVNVRHTQINEHFTYHPEMFDCCIRDGVDCEFSIGPDGGDHSLQLTFQEHAHKCHVQKCKRLPNRKTVAQTCVASRKSPPIGKGIAQFQVIRL